MPSIFLVLIAVVVIFGVAAVVVGRQRAKAVGAAPVATPIAPTAARSSEPIAAAEAKADVEAEVEPAAEVEVEVEGEPESFERPRFRDRMAKSRAALVGVFSGVRGRAGITNETWDDLEE
ncbi:MAG: signal recognition particle-docking protein FtsY, partial [Actinobacteria bacterium]|nr:signal recognition particle-docking protein FtsY [Actinomycetota bacterium]